MGCGSVGFNIGKLDAFLWYYLMFRAWKAAKIMWREDRTGLLMLMTFIVPTTFMYATSFANVGLSLRQRLIVVMVTAILAIRSWPAKAGQAEHAADEDPDGLERARQRPALLQGSPASRQNLS